MLCVRVCVCVCVPDWFDQPGWCVCGVWYTCTGTGFYALKEMGIGMFSVWKQLANLTTGRVHAVE